MYVECLSWLLLISWSLSTGPSAVQRQTATQHYSGETIELTSCCKRSADGNGWTLKRSQSSLTRSLEQTADSSLSGTSQHSSHSRTSPYSPQPGISQHSSYLGTSQDSMHVGTSSIICIPERVFTLHIPVRVFLSFRNELNYSQIGMSPFSLHPGTSPLSFHPRTSLYTLQIPERYHTLLTPERVHSLCIPDRFNTWKLWRRLLEETIFSVALLNIDINTPCAFSFTLVVHDSRVIRSIEMTHSDELIDSWIALKRLELGWI